MQIIGEELQKIADAHRVNGIGALDKHLVFEAVEADPNHPLRRFYDWDEGKAARKHWLEHSHRLIRSVHVVYVNVGKRPKFSPMFVSAETKIATGETKRMQVVSTDALANDPIFMSAVGGQIRQIYNAVAQLEAFTSSRGAPSEIVQLRVALREALDEYGGRSLFL